MAKTLASTILLAPNTNNSASFNGTAYIDFGNPDALNTSLTNKITIGCFINPTSGVNQVLFGKSHTTTQTTPFYKYLLYKITASQLATRIDTANFAGGAIQNGVWQHVALVYDGATMKGYLNGGLISSVAKTGSIQTSSQNVRAGARDTTVISEYYIGLMSNLTVWNVALTEAQILALATQLVVPTTGLILHTKMDEGSGSNFADSSGNGLTGTGTNMLWSTNTPFPPRTLAPIRDLAPTRDLA